MDLGIRGRVALIMAASKGLGFAVAQRLSIEGAKVVICARDERRLEAARAEIEAKSGNETFAFACDVTDEESLALLHGDIEKHIGQVELLVVNAGGPPAGGFEDIDDEAWKASFDLTFLSGVRMIRLCLPRMKEAKFGRILMMVSIAAKEPVANLMLSNAIRAGVMGMTKSLADEVAPMGILVNALCPGFIQTERMEAVIAAQAKAQKIPYEERLQQMQGRIPLGRLGKPEEFADAAAFLLSERANYITGGALFIDGGLCRSIM